MRSWAEMRKTYVKERVEELHGVRPPVAMNWRQYHKTIAHQEFNEFVISQQQLAIEAFKIGEWHA